MIKYRYEIVFQISTAYKRLTRLYHPDKHLDPEAKKKAEALFAKLKLAHEGRKIAWLT